MPSKFHSSTEDCLSLEGTAYHQWWSSTWRLSLTPILLTAQIWGPWKSQKCNDTKDFDSDLKISDVIFQGLYWCSTVGSRHVLSQPNLVNQSLPLPITSRGPLSFSVLIYHSWFYHIAVSLVYCTSDFLDWVPPSFIRAVQHALSAFSSNLTREVHFHIPSLKPGLFSRLAGH